MNQKQQNLFAEMGRISEPYERSAWKDRQFQVLQQANYQLQAEKQSLFYQLQVIQNQLDSIFDQLYFAVGFLQQKSDRKKLHRLIAQLERRQYRSRHNSVTRKLPLHCNSLLDDFPVFTSFQEVIDDGFEDDYPTR